MPAFDPEKEFALDTELLKAAYGRKGGPSAWRWDYAHQFPGAYPYKDLRRFEARELKGPLVLESVSSSRLELQAVLLLPHPERDYRHELVKTLCGLNCQPLLVDVCESSQ